MHPAATAFIGAKANNPIQAVRGAPIQSSSRKIRFQDEAASATRYRLVNRNK